MPCQEFKEKGYLYLSGELSKDDRDAFARHLRECADCREELGRYKALWARMEKLSADRPHREVREAILSRSRTAKRPSALGDRLKSWADLFLFHPRLTWGISAAAVALIFLFVFIRPFAIRENVMPTEELTLAWQDDFMSEADWLDKELDRYESGTLLANYSTEEMDPSGSEEWLSPMSQDLEWIRGKVEDLVKTIYGI